MPSNPQGQHRSIKDIESELRSLSVPDRLRLKKAAEYHCNRGRHQPQDLIQEAFLRALTGERKCPQNISVLVFLIQSIRSIASSDYKTDQRRSSQSSAYKQQSPDNHNTERPRVTAIPTSSNSVGEDVDEGTPEQEIIERENAQNMRKRLLERVEDDTLAYYILECVLDEMQASEIIELLEIDKRTYDTKRKFIRRRLEPLRREDKRDG